MIPEEDIYSKQVRFQLEETFMPNNPLLLGGKQKGRALGWGLYVCVCLSVISWEIFPRAGCYPRKYE